MTELETRLTRMLSARAELVDTDLDGAHLRSLAASPRRRGRYGAMLASAAAVAALAVATTALDDDPSHRAPRAPAGHTSVTHTVVPPVRHPSTTPADPASPAAPSPTPTRQVPSSSPELSRGPVPVLRTTVIPPGLTIVSTVPGRVIRPTAVGTIPVKPSRTR